MLRERLRDCTRLLAAERKLAGVGIRDAKALAVALEEEPLTSQQLPSKQLPSMSSSFVKLATRLWYRMLRWRGFTTHHLIIFTKVDSPQRSYSIPGSREDHGTTGIRILCKTGAARRPTRKSAASASWVPSAPLPTSLLVYFWQDFHAFPVNVVGSSTDVA